MIWNKFSIWLSSFWQSTLQHVTKKSITLNISILIPKWENVFSKMLKKCQETIKVYCVLIRHRFWIWLYLGNNPFTTSHFMGRLVCFLFINKSRHCKFAPQLMIFELCISKWWNLRTDFILLQTFFSSENWFLSKNFFLIPISSMLL